MSLTDTVSQSIIHSWALHPSKEIAHLSSTERAMLIDILGKVSVKRASRRQRQIGLLNQRNGSTRSI